ncbi:MAG: alpha amylase N-terminal ig-like domain-containing protein [Candidatus Schekmanbacteria bacterium]|nr:alpha amylase N-terminal ig-like domain-containing protein [Candidatus Schekmanbacteria bacterium]
MSRTARYLSSIACAPVLPIVAIAAALLVSSPPLLHAAAADNNVEWDGLFSDQSANFMTPTEPSASDNITVRLRAFRNDLTAAAVRYWDGAERFVSMTKTSTDTVYDYYSGVIPAHSETIWYRFRITDGSKSAWYNPLGPSDAEPSSRDFQIIPGLSTPDWLKNGVIYQIFVDRFFDGDSGNNVGANEYSLGVHWDGDHQGDPARAYTHSSWSHQPDNALKHLANAGTDPGAPQDEGLGRMTYAANVDFFGGDLAGVAAKLDYLQDLGVTVLYLNPIFASPSNHKYDTMDFRIVDPHFGGNAALHDLIDAAHGRGMKVVIDGVFNHTGHWHRWLNRRDGDEALATGDYAPYAEDGAFQAVETGQFSVSSDGVAASTVNAAVDRYTFRDMETYTAACQSPLPKNGVIEADEYFSWWGFSSLPKINYDADSNGDGMEELRYWLYGGPNGIGNLGESASGTVIAGSIAEEVGTTKPIARLWIEDFGVDGWRLDVPNDAGGRSAGYPTSNDHAIWKGFRKAVRNARLDTYIFGELWTESDVAPYLDNGDEFDAVMNYHGFADPVSLWVNGQNTAAEKTTTDLGQADIMTVDQLDSWLSGTRASFAGPIVYAMDNLLDSHDSPRFLRRTKAHKILKGWKEGSCGFYSNPDFYDGSGEDVWKLKLALFLQMSYVGAPSLFYGDEVGLSGADDPSCRQPFNWNYGQQSWRVELRDLVKKLIAARKQYSALRTGSMMTLYRHNDNQIYAFGRWDSGARITVVLNNSSYAQDVSVPVWKLAIPDGNNVLEDALTGARLTVASGHATVHVDGHFGALLVNR